MQERLYLDHASTSWPKAEGVIAAMADYLSDCGASASRGNYAAARDAEQIVQRVRRRLVETIHAESLSTVSFHPGCTAALNAAIHGLLHSSDHAVASAVEHNSVIRPLLASCETTIVPCQSDGIMNVEHLVSAIQPRTRLVALSHASNVTGIVQPIAELSRAIATINESRPKQERVFVLCDAAQTFGYLPIDVREVGVDGLAAPAHKGSGGPTGIAMLYLNPDWHDRIRSTIQGGSGHDGLAEAMPTMMPSRLEAGTMNVAAIAGWDAALGSTTPNVQSKSHLDELSRQLRRGLESIDGIQLWGRRGELPIASIGFGPMLPPADAAAVLDHEFKIEVRAGFHCAARLHEHLGSTDGGTVRISCGHSTKPNDLDRLFIAITELAESLS